MKPIRSGALMNDKTCQCDRHRYLNGETSDYPPTIKQIDWERLEPWQIKSRQSPLDDAGLYSDADKGSLTRIPQEFTLG